jgi:glycerophosphoryl diester phosphodiesterase
MTNRLQVASVAVLWLGIFASPAHAAHIVVISHRGEHLHHPENTIAAYQAAAEAGADYFETDVRTSKDGQLVILHNSTLDGMTNGHGKIADRTLAEIEAFDAGIKFSEAFHNTRIPLFTEVLSLAAAAHIGVYVDTKDADPQKLVDAIVATHMEDHVIIYGSDELLTKVQQIDPKLAVMPEAVSVAHTQMILEKLHPQVMAFEEGDFTPEIIELVKRHGVRIYVDRLGEQDDPSHWSAAIAAGADGVQTNKPAEAVRYFELHQEQPKPATE